MDKKVREPNDIFHTRGTQTGKTLFFTSLKKNYETAKVGYLRLSSGLFCNKKLNDLLFSCQGRFRLNEKKKKKKDNQVTSNENDRGVVLLMIFHPFFVRVGGPNQKKKIRIKIQSFFEKEGK